MADDLSGLVKAVTMRKWEELNDPKKEIVKNEINLWVLVDSFGKIYYTGNSEQTVENFKDGSYKDCKIIKLTGFLPEKE